MERKFYDPEYDRIVSESVPKNNMRGFWLNRGLIKHMKIF